MAAAVRDLHILLLHTKSSSIEVKLVLETRSSVGIASCARFEGVEAEGLAKWKGGGVSQCLTGRKLRFLVITFRTYCKSDYGYVSIM